MGVIVIIKRKIRSGVTLDTPPSRASHNQTWQPTWAGCTTFRSTFLTRRNWQTTSSRSSSLTCSLPDWPTSPGSWLWGKEPRCSSWTRDQTGAERVWVNTDTHLIHAGPPQGNTARISPPDVCTTSAHIPRWTLRATCVSRCGTWKGHSTLFAIRAAVSWCLPRPCGMRAVMSPTRWSDL